MKSSNGFVISAIAMMPRNIVARLKIFVNPVIEITTGLSMTRDNIPCFACLKYSSSFALAAGAAVSVSPIVSLKITCARTSFCLGVYREGACALCCAEAASWRCHFVAFYKEMGGAGYLPPPMIRSLLITTTHTILFQLLLYFLILLYVINEIKKGGYGDDEKLMMISSVVKSTTIILIGLYCVVSSK